MEVEVKEFIAKHRDLSIPTVALLLSKQPNFPKDFILDQINGWQKAKSKFPFLNQTSGYIFPSSRAVSQSSSEIAASYKANILKANVIADLTGGMGMDSYFLSQNAEELHYVESNPDLYRITEENFKKLGATNVKCHHTSAEEFLKKHREKVTAFYIDPDRRQNKEKAFKIEDCEPNVKKLLPLMLENGKQCLIKLSPMIDLTQALIELKYCKEVHVLSVNNDCKEVLFLLDETGSGDCEIHTINFTSKREEKFTFTFAEEKQLSSEFSNPMNYLYEPNSSILKAGAFKSIANHFELKKLAVNSHLYTSEELIENFPGRVIEIAKTGSPKKGLVEKANVIARNFPLTAEQIKKKYKIADGGSTYVYATSLHNEKKVFILGERR